ncbi:TonB-dependent receptor plug domain-containing protein [Flavobacterium sp. LC2016-23]|uniref:carboxypeptidase-like regulatory domain-containing protein n=1 Tax=Flavobacterium sp. LC2016-23 TaxID=2666330 RepID=UPI0012AF6DB6|nr:carboxypeptidase-like regulatory domain-containing protein [Flavobacterium sp. LC2016-23]MRX41483.1 TonB-dependent receptor plug domain-containing protein [Flavobacterium sp. LC2016-23]
MKSLKLLSLVLAMLVGFVSAAQQKIITGTVSDYNTVLLAGASVKIQQSGKETATNFEGEYTIAAQKGDSLIFSYVGCQLQTQVVGNKNVMNVQLTTSPPLPEKFGYNPQITDKQYLRLTESQIRNIDSVPSNKEPLYIVDGVPVKSQQIARINPYDIENISVLKENEATSLYGIRAYYGAIIISTKNEVYKNLTAEETAIELMKLPVPFSKKQIKKDLNY